jgi:alanyl-tRNA synthetase
MKPGDKKFTLVEKVTAGDDCVLVLDKSNFYPESGGQVADKGVLKATSKDLLVEVKHVLSLQNLTFHVGKALATTSTSSVPTPQLDINDSVQCQVDSKSRYFTSLNHTAVHLLNHSIRSRFGKESCVIQTGSSVTDTSFRLEFKFNEMLVDKLSVDDLTVIQDTCKRLIENQLPVYINENIDLERVVENKKLQYPVRMLNDVLYPRIVRVVSVGEKFESFENGWCTIFN